MIVTNDFGPDRVSVVCGFPAPVPSTEKRINREVWVFDLALKARMGLVSRPYLGETLFPLADVASKVAEHFCNGSLVIRNAHAEQWRASAGSAPEGIAWLASAITEILAGDPVTRAYLSSHGLSCGSSTKNGGES